MSWLFIKIKTFEQPLTDRDLKFLDKINTRPHAFYQASHVLASDITIAAHTLRRAKAHKHITNKTR